jgi:ubiquinone/menaquinone biosynthesis C-methylase UbiE
LTNRSNVRPTDDFRARWKSDFEHRATDFDDDAGIAGWTTSGLNTRFRSFRRLWIGARRSTLWLDIGCGAGTYTRFLAAEGLSVIGIDYSLPTLVKARARSAPGISWVTGDATRLPIREGSTDGALCFGVLQAVAATESVLQAIARAMKPAGTLWIDALNARCIPNSIEIRRRHLAGKPPHLRYETAETLRAALRESGFDTIMLHWVPILPPRLQWLQPLAESRPVRWILRCAPALAARVSHSILVEARRRGNGEHT